MRVIYAIRRGLPKLRVTIPPFMYSLALATLSWTYFTFTQVFRGTVCRTPSGAKSASLFTPGHKGLNPEVVVT